MSIILIASKLIVIVALTIMLMNIILLLLSHAHKVIWVIM